MTTTSLSYGTAVTVTMTSSGLASSSTLLAGRQSNTTDNSTTLNVDHLVGGKAVTQSSATSNTQIQVWAFGTYDGTSFTAGASTADANFTPDAGAKNQMKLLTIITSTTTSAAVTYAWGPYSVAQAFGGVLPQKWGVFIVHNIGVALSSGCELKYTPVNYTSA